MAVARVLLFIAVEIALLVTPMVFPTIPFEWGMFIYGVVIALLIGAVFYWLIDRKPEAKSSENRSEATDDTIRSVEDLSKSDFPECMKISKGLTIKGAHKEGAVHLCINWHSHSKFLMIYLPFTEHVVGAIRELASEVPKTLDLLQSTMQVFSKDPGDISDVDMSTIPFVNRVVVYYESRIPLQDAAKLIEEYREKGLTLVLRGSDYATQRWLSVKAEGEAVTKPSLPKDAK